MQDLQKQQNICRKNEHDERIDIEYKIIGTEANWLKRGIKEAKK